MSRVIRGGPPRGVVPREVYDAREEADGILEDAAARAEAVLAQAEAEASAIREEARRAGREAGLAEAAAQLARAAATRDQALAAAERDTATVALAAARRIVVEELALAPERIAAIVAEALGRARRATEVVVTVHPEDARALASLRDEVASRTGQPARFVLREDASLTRGGCIVETDLGEIDARIEVQLDALARALGL